MFDTKQDSLIEKKKAKATTTKPSSANAFVAGGLKAAAVTSSGNGALKYSTTGNEFVDQYGKMGAYKSPRTFSEISNDMTVLWAVDKLKAVAFVFYLRLISRLVQFTDGSKTETVQRGGGLRHEGIFRMMWLHVYHPDVFWKNINLYISIASWKDIFTMLIYDLKANGWEKRKLDWDKFGKLILAGLENPNTSELIKKYLPQIKAESATGTLDSQAKTIIGKWLASLLFGSKLDKGHNTSYTQYRKIKSNGTAHQWQQLISQGKHNLIDFDTVHGRALAQLVSGKYIENQKLAAKYQEWIAAKPTAKFTGYPHELFEKRPSEKYQIDTLNAQFMQLVEVGRSNAVEGTSLIVVRDTSGSMGSQARGTNSTCYDVAKSLALFFAEMLPAGAFANAWIEFNSTAKMHVWKGSTPYEKWNNDHSNFVGGTNFQSVIQLFASMKNGGIPESEFPTGILCVSDSEFNPVQLGRTNVEIALQTLRNAGFSEEYVSNFKIVLWNLQSYAYGASTGQKFETYGDVDNVYYFSGYDGSTIAFLTGTQGQSALPKNAAEVVDVALSQEVMQLIEV